MNEDEWLGQCVCREPSSFELPHLGDIVLKETPLNPQSIEINHRKQILADFNLSTRRYACRDNRAGYRRSQRKSFMTTGHKFSGAVEQADLRLSRAQAGLVHRYISLRLFQSFPRDNSVFVEFFDPLQFVLSSFQLRLDGSNFGVQFNSVLTR